MKSKFSTTWIASSQPRKQRKYVHNAPRHIKGKFMAATLSKELRKKYETRNIEVRKGDEVKLNETKIAVENLQRTKKDGTKINVWFNPSNVKIVLLDNSDNKRFKHFKKQIKEVNNTESKTEKENAHKDK